MTERLDASEVEELLRAQSADPNKRQSTGVLGLVERASMRFNTAMAAIAGVLIVAIVVITLIDVGGRYFFSSPLEGAIEIEKILMGFIALVPMAYTLLVGGHVRFTLIIDRLKGRPRAGLELLSALLGMFFFLWLIRGGWDSFQSSWEVKETMPTTIDLPYWLPKFMLPFGSTLIALQFLLVAIRQVCYLVAPADSRSAEEFAPEDEPHPAAGPE